MATIFIFDLIITIDKNLYVIYNIFHNQGVFIMENEKENNKVNIKPFIILFLISIIIFAIVYFLHSKNIENRFNRTLQNYEKSMSAIFNNMVITNGNNENIYTNLSQTNNNIVINNNQLQNNSIENLKLSFEVGFKMLESSMNEIMKNSNDILQFWFTFLSVIMIVFTIIGFFLNNNILDSAKKQLEIVEKEARTSRENIKKETKRLIEENNKNIQEYNLFNLGIQSINSKDYKLAIYYFNEVIKLNVNNVEAHYNKGLAKHYLADNEKGNKEEYNKFINEAIEDYNKAIELNPNYSEAYNNRGIAKSDLGNLKEALEDYNKSVELNPYYSDPYNNIGVIMATLNEYEEALKNFNKSIELNPYYAKLYFNRGKAKSNLVNLKEKNSEEYNKLANEAYNDFEIAYNLSKDELKEELKDKILQLAKEGYKDAIEFCKKYNINYKYNKE